MPISISSIDFMAFMVLSYQVTQALLATSELPTTRQLSATAQQVKPRDRDLVLHIVTIAEKKNTLYQATEKAFLLTRPA